MCAVQDFCLSQGLPAAKSNWIDGWSDGWYATCPACYMSEANTISYVLLAAAVNGDARKYIDAFKNANTDWSQLSCRAVRYEATPAQHM